MIVFLSKIMKNHHYNNNTKVLSVKGKTMKSIKINKTIYVKAIPKPFTIKSITKIINKTQKAQIIKVSVISLYKSSSYQDVGSKSIPSERHSFQSY